MTIAAARPASTVVLLRPSPARFDVFLVKRPDASTFMGGAHVFPGGSVDPRDRLAPTRELRMPDLEPSDATAYYVAAARELFEEAGVRVELEALVPFAHWITPEQEARRFDVRFFMTALPAGQDPSHDQRELSESVWLDPSAAIEQCRADAIALPPPTWTTLRMLEKLTSVEAALAWAREQPIVAVRPRITDRDGVRTLTLPGDPEHPAIPGFETPAETRFVLDGRRWRPAKPE